MTYLRKVSFLIYVDELLLYTNTGVENSNKTETLRDCYVIFLHALQNGLLKVKLQGPESRWVLVTYGFCITLLLCFVKYLHN